LADFPPARLKIRRAYHHLDELTAIITAYLAENPENERPSTSTHEGRLVPSVKFRVNALPDVIPAVIGDVIHNARVSLDAVAGSMAEAEGKNPKNVYFAFADSAGNLDQRVKQTNFYFCGQDAVDLLKTLKPYKGGNDELRGLHDLDNVDKHQGLLPEATYGIAVHTGNPLMRTHVYNPSKPLAIVTIQFPPIEPFKGRELLPCLKSLVELSESVVEAFIALKMKP